MQGAVVLLYRSLLATFILVSISGCGKDAASDLATPPPQKQNPVNISGPVTPAAPAPAPNTPPPSGGTPSPAANAQTGSNPDWKPGDGEPPAGKFPAAVKRDFGEDGKPNMESLTLAMRDWSYFTDRFPKDINELVTTKYLVKIPTPPAGKQYGIDKGSASVVLVDTK